MAATVLHKTAQLGQSIWLDSISRKLLMTGELEDWIDKGVSGVTTNPSIFEQAIAKTTDYDGEIRALAGEGKSASDIYEFLTLQEVGAAADVLRPVYDRTGGLDGYVSLEVNPLLAEDASSTVSEARRLFSALSRPNVMIKIPATPEGVTAVETCIADGVNVNATLIFSTKQYVSVAEAYIGGLRQRAEKGLPLSVASVASVFVSRIDTAADALLSSKGEDFSDLKGHIALDNALMTYAEFQRIFATEPWNRLSKKGARVQRPLWASTGTKNPAYSDVLYVENLIGKDTVNTVPPATLNAFLEHGKAETREDREPARLRLARLAKSGVDLDAVCAKLLKEGLNAFNVAFDLLIQSLAKKMG
ncbi:MAG: transaldolase [Synergistaceae bacterium]|jgi:transaldolase|nr:transaldolase [Synergistaceae bacterium]